MIVTRIREVSVQQYDHGYNEAMALTNIYGRSLFEIDFV